MIRRVEKQDAAAICSIYNYYIVSTAISFEESEVSVEEMEERIASHGDDYPWLVSCTDDGRVTGYCYASPWGPRSAYRFSAELSVYIDKNAHGQGIASALYRELFALLRKNMVHAVFACISVPNDPSRLFHEKMGFVNVAQFREIGRKFNKWIDVCYWELML